MKVITGGQEGHNLLRDAWDFGAMSRRGYFSGEYIQKKISDNLLFYWISPCFWQSSILYKISLSSSLFLLLFLRPLFLLNKRGGFTMQNNCKIQETWKVFTTLYVASRNSLCLLFSYRFVVNQKMLEWPFQCLERCFECRQAFLILVDTL